jgi:hypothetical protein
MDTRKVLLAAGFAAGLAAFSTAGCGGGSPTAPPSPTIPQPAAATGLLFIGSGCACSPPPYPLIAIYVDGKQAGTVQIFGQLSVPLAPGMHTWSTAPGGGGTQVMVQPGSTVNIDIPTNFNCGGGCPVGPHGSSGSGGVGPGGDD